jgi:hypothetical protein
MKQRHSLKRAYIIFIDFILPFPLTIVAFYLWWQRTSSILFSLYPLVVGVLFGYIFPGIGTNLLNLWKFNGPFRIKNYFLHQGFMYAPYLSLIFYVSFTPNAPFDFGMIIRAIVFNAFLQSALSCHHDICGVTIGMIEINNTPSKQKKSPVEIVTHSCAIAFALMGASFAASCLFAYYTLVLRKLSDLKTFLILVCLGLTFMGLVSMYYVIKERRHISWEWTARFRRARKTPKPVTTAPERLKEPV